MIIILPQGCTSNEARNALDTANRYFDDNVRFKRFDVGNIRRDGRLPINITLTVRDSKEIGSRRTSGGGRICAACWHAHGVFFDSLPSGTEIRTMQATLLAGDSWIDVNIGSQAYPLKASRACNCSDWSVSGELPFAVNA